MTGPTIDAQHAALRTGRRLQYVTITWNLMEVFVTIGLGIAARSLALVAFGLDSLVEVFVAGGRVVYRRPPTRRTGSARASPGSDRVRRTRRVPRRREHLFALDG